MKNTDIVSFGDLLMEKHFLRFTLAGIFILSIAGVFYLVYRPESLIMKVLLGDFVLSGVKPQFVGIGSLPSLFHTLAFCFLTAAFIKLTYSNIIKISLFWFLTNTAYEIFSFSEYAKNSKIQFHGDAYDVIYSFFGIAIFIAFNALGKVKHTYKR